MLLGIAIGFGVAALLVHRKHRWQRRWLYAQACHGGYGPPHGWHDHHRHHRGWGWRSGPYHLMAVLDTTPGQEKVIREEAARLRDRAKVAKDDVAAARTDVAEVLRADVFDRARFDAALGRVDSAWGDLKQSVGDSIARVHDTLDSRQRERLADLLSRTRRGPSFGPFR